MDELLSKYGYEIQEYLQRIGEGVLALERGDVDAETIDDLCRQAHSLKGVLGIVGSGEPARIAHVLEDLLIGFREGTIRPTPQVADEMLHALDALGEELQEGKGEREQEGLPHAPMPPCPHAGSLPGVIRRLEGLLEGTDEVPQADALTGVSPEMREVLTEDAEDQVRRARASGSTLFEISLYFKDETFLTEVRTGHERLAEVGEVIARSGSSDAAPEGYDLHFKVLLSSEKRAEEVEAHLGSLRCEIREIEAEEPVEEKPPEEMPAPVDPVPLLDDEDMAELGQMYLEGKSEELAELDRLILSLEKAPSDTEALNEIFRQCHSMKGTGGTFGYPIVTDLCHEMESLVDRVRRGRMRVSSELIDLLLRSVDELKGIFSDAKAGTLDQDMPRTIFQELTAFTEESSETSEEPSPEAVEMPKVPSNYREESIRVGLDVLDRLVNMTSEIMVSKTAGRRIADDIENMLELVKESDREWNAIKYAMEGRTGPSATGAEVPTLVSGGSRRIGDLRTILERLQEYVDSWYSRFDVLANELQQETVNVRMLPISSVFNPLLRTVRDLCRQRGKEISLELSGKALRLDKRVLEEIRDPLMHMVRNAVDHGVESPEERIRVGKARAGALQLSAFQSGTQAIVEVEDDGAGMDLEAIRKVALERGLISPDQSLSERDMQELIFRPGFSTSREVTQVSGRGVGMDVVGNAIGNLGGTVDISSRKGRGTKITLRVPLTLAMDKGLAVRAGGERFLIPITAILGVYRVSDADIQVVEGVETVAYEESFLPLVRVVDLLGLTSEDRKGGFILVLQVAKRCMAFLVDELLTEQEMVVRNLGTLLADVEGVLGTTIMPDGKVAVILDPRGLIERAESSYGVKSEMVHGLEQEERPPEVLVVEDSVIARELLRSIVETAGYRASTATDGIDALDQLRRHRFDLVLTDVRMPGMDGFELTTRIKQDERLKGIPVVLVTARESEEDRRRGLEVGADAYIVKGAFDQGNLLATVRDFVGAA